MEGNENVSNFMVLMDRLLFSSTHPFEDLHISCYYHGFESYRIDVWVRVAFWRKVQELYLRVYLQHPAMPPSYLFTSNTLVGLKLDLLFELNLPARVCLPRLKVLDLRQLMYAPDDSLERLIAGCPVLEDFFREHCWLSNIGRMQEF
ncbi:LRR_2 domain-containing protein [Cephalotus follicularis]|uniref:LRR_2 domain-containing protein n=1 Tax=Cephalotus follicularis TaxID=3775 RepID=A0A1Q3C3E4_CEPFO|nr:LRR_2 domain-containing protein [Cephalotus follicularis]